MGSSKFYSWMFHYNKFTDTWTGFHRDDHTAYWNKSEFIHPVYKAKEIKDLLTIMNESIKDTQDV